MAKISINQLRRELKFKKGIRKSLEDEINDIEKAITQIKISIEIARREVEEK